MATVVHTCCEIDGLLTLGPSVHVHACAVPLFVALSPVEPDASVTASTIALPGLTAVVPEHDMLVVELVLVAEQSSDGVLSVAPALVATKPTTHSNRLSRAVDIYLDVRCNIRINQRPRGA